MSDVIADDHNNGLVQHVKRQRRFPGVTHNELLKFRRQCPRPRIATSQNQELNDRTKAIRVYLTFSPRPDRSIGMKNIKEVVVKANSEERYRYLTTASSNLLLKDVI